jgi:hypothetical protein
MNEFLGWVYLYRSKINRWNKNTGRDVGRTESITTTPGRKENVDTMGRGLRRGDRKENEGWGNK